jgi:hypothetical protein
VHPPEHHLAGRAYRINFRWRAFAAVWTGIGGLVTGSILFDEISANEDPGLWLVVVAFLWIVGGLLWFSHMCLATVTLFPDAIETRGLLGRARLRFEDIRGRRQYVATGDEGGDTHYLKIEPNDDRLPTLDFMRDYDFDYIFYDWFGKLPDLDAADRLKVK